jgi:hypothetical protein
MWLKIDFKAVFIEGYKNLILTYMCMLFINEIFVDGFIFIMTI